jgi:hypothetical protein
MVSIFPPAWRCSPRPRPQVVILVIILAFVVVMAGLGYAPAVALGVVAAALAAAGTPGRPGLPWEAEPVLMAELSRAGRPENPITEDGPVAELARALRQAREQAGQPSYRALAQRTHYSPSVLAAAADGRYCPTWGVTSAFLQACGAGEADLRPLWEKASTAARKSRSSDRRQRERTRASGGPDPRPGRRGEVRDQVPGEPGPRRAATAAQYVRQLRALRAWAGQPGYKTIIARIGATPATFPRSTMYDALNPYRTRLPPLEVVQGIVRACASPGTAEAWTAIWRAIRLREFEQDNPPAADDGPAAAESAVTGRPPLRVVHDRLPVPAPARPSASGRPEFRAGAGTVAGAPRAVTERVPLSYVTPAG